MKKKIYFFLYLLPFTFYPSQGFSQAVLSPDVKCVSVAGNGDVTLRWVTPAGPGSFVDYKIFSSTNPITVPFTLVASILSYPTTSYTHVGAGANANRVYYLVQSEYDLGSGAVLSAPIDTFSTIYLTISDPGNTGHAHLAWNSLASPNIPTSTGSYKIYRQYPIGQWSLIDSVNTNSINIIYTDKFHLCGDSISYFISVSDNTGCSSFSNVSKTYIEDSDAPTPEPIDTVSVDATGLATISWIPSPSSDVDSIIIYKGGPPWVPIASVKAPLTFYTYSASNATNASETFKIVFKDSCGNPSPQSDPHNTIYLSATFDPCAGKADLVWNKYINMKPADPTQYEVLASVNGGAFNIIANINGTAYTDTGLVFGTAYCYLIRATNGPKTSSSNKTCFTPSVANPPRFNYNRFATVVSDKSILVSGHVDTSSSVTYYRIARSSGSSGVFNLLPSVIPKPAGNAITYPDNDVNTQAESYSYKWEAMNSCNKPIMTSNVGTTILLKAAVAPNVNIDLSWNDYGHWLGDVDHYEIHRAVDGVWNPSPIASVNYSGTGGFYTDIIDTATILHSMGIFSYYIMAIEGSGNTFGFQDSSKSNVAKIFEYPKIFVPNTFTPNGDGLNDTFKPITGFINPSAYSLRIYDNYGYPVMESTNPEIGWDGKMKGRNCQEGVYMYVVNCTASNGDNSQLSGTISLIR